MSKYFTLTADEVSTLQEMQDVLKRDFKEVSGFGRIGMEGIHVANAYLAVTDLLARGRATPWRQPSQ